MVLLACVMFPQYPLAVLQRARIIFGVGKNPIVLSGGPPRTDVLHQGNQQDIKNIVAIIRP